MYFNTPRACWYNTWHGIWGFWEQGAVLMPTNGSPFLKQRKLLWVIFFHFILIVLVFGFLIIWLASAKLRDSHRDHLQIQLQKTARFTAVKLRPFLVSGDLQSVKLLLSENRDPLGTRISVFNNRGLLLADSHGEGAAGESGDNRTEVKEALSGKEAVAIRFNRHIQEKMMFTALPVALTSNNRVVIRTGLPIADLNHYLTSFRWEMAAVGLFMVFLVSLVLFNLSKKIERPFAELKASAQNFVEGNFKKTLFVSDYAELAELTKTINLMGSRLRERMLTISQQRNEVEAILSSMNEAVMAVNSKGQILKINNTMATLFDLDADSCRGQNIKEVIRNEAFTRFVDQSLKEDERVVADLTLYKNNQRFLRAGGTRLRDSKDQVLGAVIVLNDVTRLMKLEDVRRDFVANVSHELKTPVTLIKGFVETLRSGAAENPKDTKRFLKIIARHADRLNDIIEDLLWLSKIEQGQHQISDNLQVCNLKNPLHSAIQSCSGKAKKKKIDLSLECPESLIARIHLNLFEQAITNLIDNAIKYSDGGKKVRVVAQKEGPRIQIQVKDQGFGIPKNHLTRLFERFYRVDKARSRDVGGTGLGLSIVKHITQAHGGSISVESMVQEGSTFTISLPTVETQTENLHSDS